MEKPNTVLDDWALLSCFRTMMSDTNIPNGGHAMDPKCLSTVDFSFAVLSPSGREARDSHGESDRSAEVGKLAIL